MNTKLGRYFFLALLSVSSLITINAQQQPASVVSDLYVVSAEAGGINLVSGDVKIRSGSDRLAIKGDKMVAGERMITGADGRAEVLLNPGSFLRLSQNTEFEFTSTDLDNLRIKLERGTAIVEFYSVNDLTMSVSTPGPEFRLMKSGVYRIDVLNGTSKISVWKGIAAVGGLSQRVIGKGMSITVSGGQYSEAKFDRDIMDAFDSWSKLRSGELAALNARLRRDSMQRTILASANDDWWLNRNTGIWVYDRDSRNHCFVPFRRRNNAYGHNVSQNIGNYNVPNPPPGNNNAANPSETPISGVDNPRPGKGRRHKKDPNEDDGDREYRGRQDGNRNEGRDRSVVNDSQPANDSRQVRNEDTPRVPRKMKEDDDREVRENRREERSEERRTEERRSRDEERRSESPSSGSGSSGSSSGSSGGSSNSGGSQSSPPPSPPPPPPSNPSPPPDPPQRDSMPERKGDPPR